jgi:hypothetical protein
MIEIIGFVMIMIGMQVILNELKEIKEQLDRIERKIK